MDWVECVGIISIFWGYLKRGSGLLYFAAPDSMIERELDISREWFLSHR